MPQNLYINTQSVGLATGFVLSELNPIPLDQPFSFVYGDKRVLNVYLVDGDGGFDSGSGAAGYTLKMAITGTLGGSQAASQSSWTLITNGWTGSIDLNTSGIAALVSGVESVEAWLEVEVTDTSGNIHTCGQQKIDLRNQTIDPTTPSATPVGTYLTASETRDQFVQNRSAVTGLTGGGATKLDGITTLGVTVGQMAAVTLSNSTSHYQLVAGTDAESSPTVIRPDDYASSTNEKVWKLTAITSAGLTVNGASSLGGNLTFATDNTYDIGASGATRPRDLFLGRNAVIGGTLAVTGQTTLATSLTGVLKGASGVVSAITAAANQVTYWSDANTPAGSTTFLFASNRLLLGHTATITVDGDDMRLQVSANGAEAGININRFSNDTAAPFLNLTKSRNGTVGSHTMVSSGDSIGAIAFLGSNGSVYKTAARIICSSIGTPGASSMGADLEFWTVPDASLSIAKHWSIKSTGVLEANGTKTIQTSSGILVVTGSGGLSLTSGTSNTLLTQNSVNVLTSEGSGAVVNTLYLKQGSVGIGTTSPFGRFSTAISDDVTEGWVNEVYSTAGNYPEILLRRSRGTLASPTTVSSGDTIGNIIAQGWDGSAWRQGAGIAFEATGSISSRVPGIINFYTKPDSGTGLTKQWSVMETGIFQSNGAQTIQTSSGTLTIQPAGLTAFATTSGALLAGTSTQPTNAIFAAVGGITHVRRDSNSVISALDVNNLDTTVSGTQGAGITLYLARDSDATARAAAFIYAQKEAAWTSTASTNDAKLVWQVAVDGTLTTRMTLSSAGVADIVGGLKINSTSVITSSATWTNQLVTYYDGSTLNSATDVKVVGNSLMFFGGSSLGLYVGYTSGVAYLASASILEATGPTDFHVVVDDGATLLMRDLTGGNTYMSMITAGGAAKIGFFGVSPSARASAYTPSNVTTDRSYDADATSTAELADVLGTLIADLKLYGLLQ